MAADGFFLYVVHNMADDFLSAGILPPGAFGRWLDTETSTPGGLAYGDGSLWLDTGPYTIRRLHPVTGEFQDILSDSRYGRINDLAYQTGDDYLWASSQDRDMILKIDLSKIHRGALMRAHLTAVDPPSRPLDSCLPLVPELPPEGDIIVEEFYTGSIDLTPPDAPLIFYAVDSEVSIRLSRGEDREVRIDF